MVRAVVLPAVGAPLEIAEIDLPEPGPGQVRIRLAAAGVCHSDLSLSNGSTLTGTVTALSFTGDAPSLTVATSTGATLSGVSLSQIAAVRGPEAP